MTKRAIRLLEQNKSTKKREIKKYTKDAVSLYEKALRKLAYT
jgi:hypothetical protein